MHFNIYIREKLTPSSHIILAPRRRRTDTETKTVRTTVDPSVVNPCLRNRVDLRPEGEDDVGFRNSMCREPQMQMARHIENWR